MILVGQGSCRNVRTTDHKIIYYEQQIEIHIRLFDSFCFVNVLIVLHFFLFNCDALKYVKFFRLLSNHGFRFQFLIEVKSSAIFKIHYFPVKVSATYSTVTCKACNMISKDN